MTDTDQRQKGIIAFFAYNSVAANLMMVFIIIMGIVSYFTIQRQMFPNQERDYVQVSAVYRGASAHEIEEGILIKIEEALKDVPEIKQMISRARRNSGTVSLEIEANAALAEVVDKIKMRVDGIASFPSEMEPVRVTQAEFQQNVIELAVVGDASLSAIKPIAKQVESDLLQLSNVSLVELYDPDDEIAIEIHPQVLRKYDLSLTDVMDAIRKHSANFSAGELRTNSGIVSLRVQNQLYDGEEFRAIPVKIGDHGAKVYLRDIATIKDEFTEGEYYFRYSGKNGILMSVRATKDQNMIPVAQSVKDYIAHKNESLPPGLELKTLVDMTYYLNARLDMMLSNLFQGSILVAIMLTVFLRFRLAFWVMVGLPVCFLGAMALMPAFGITINITSLFAFIMVLGIVVDDAIVIGESAYTEIEKKGGGIENVIRGAKRVATPATFGVLTTIAVFAPFTFTSGSGGVMFVNIAVVVILCLVFSLIESKLILPAHIARAHFTPLRENSWRVRFNKRFFGFVNGRYRSFVSRCTQWRWTVLAAFVAMLLISFGLIQANYVRTVPTPKIPHDFPDIRVEMGDNASEQMVIDALQTIEKVVYDVEKEIIDEYGRGMVKDTMAFNEGRSVGRIVIPLVDEELRPFNTFELARRWRERLPDIAGMKSLNIRDELMSNTRDGEFAYVLFGKDISQLNQAGKQLIGLLQEEKGLYDISSTIDALSKEVRLSLLPVAYDLGLDMANIANQVGVSFYGGEAQRMIRNGEEIRVMVRYPRLSRERFAELKYTAITTPSGKQVMLGDVVTLEEAPGISYIRREGGYRSVYVWGAIDEEVVEPNEVVDKIEETLIPQITERYPMIKTELGGAIEEQQAQQNEQMMFFVAGMILVYILLAVPLKSYGQPIIIMSVIPFSLTGAIWGHFFFGLDLSMMSTFGLIAAAGVVINDSLVMTDYINRLRQSGIAIKDAVVEAGCARFRAITLTSITTFVGVLPIMFETSLQARFVIPMAVALGFAVLFATLVTLILVPCLYLILLDTRKPFSWIKQTLSKRLALGPETVQQPES